MKSVFLVSAFCFSPPESFICSGSFRCLPHAGKNHLWAGVGEFVLCPIRKKYFWFYSPTNARNGEFLKICFPGDFVLGKGKCDDRGRTQMWLLRGGELMHMAPIFSAR